MTAPTAEALAPRMIEAGAEPRTAVTLASMVLDRLTYGPTGIPVVVGHDGKPALDPSGGPMSVATLIDGFRREMPFLFTSLPTASTSTTSPAGESLTARVHREAQQRRQHAEATRTEGPNPWSASSWNVTMQTVIAARDPSRAARLQAEAGR